MNHERAEDLLSAFLDDDLKQEVRAEVAAHVASCARCRAELDDFRAIRDLARKYEPPTPRSDPWDRIAPELPARRSRRVGLIGWALAASVVAVVAVQIARSPRVAPAPETLLPEGRGVATPAATPHDAGYARRVEELEGLFAAARGGMDPHTVAVIEDSLQQIEEALERATRALAEDPNNELLRALVERSREQKLRLLEDVESFS